MEVGVSVGCRVSGGCRKSLEEDLCARIELPVKLVVFCPRGCFIHVELRDCSEISDRLLGAWRKLEIHDGGTVFRMEKIAIGTSPMEFGPSTFVQEPAVAIRFVPFSCLN